MAIAGVNNYTAYTDYYTDTKQKRVSENTATTTDKQKAEKSYRNAREYKTYLTEKYDCLRSTDYSVAINGSFLGEAAGDEKKARWLEYNLSLIPKTVEKTKAMVEARGSQVLSYHITINGYDSMTTELCGKFEADPGTEKAREELKEKIEKIREEKKAEKKKAEEKRAEEAAKKERQYNMRIEGKDVADVTKQFADMVSSLNLKILAGSYNSTFDMKV